MTLEEEGEKKTKKVSVRLLPLLTEEYEVRATSKFPLNAEKAKENYKSHCNFYCEGSVSAVSS